MIKRLIQLPKQQSYFLLGPRQTGKSTLIESLLKPSAWKVNLLLTDAFHQYSQNPSLFRKQALEKIAHEKVRVIFVDEIQRVPALLNEIQFLMDHTTCQFVLTGSSARKLKRGHANLLAGRAVERHLFPFVFEEIKERFDLNDVLMFGALPAVFGKAKREKIDILSAYAHIYLREEIQSEGIVRNLGGFSRFLDMAASGGGELVSFSAVSRECHLPVRTVQSYYEILEDTLIGFRLEPWHRSVRKRMVSHPKFYFFDLGVLNAINRRLTAGLNRELLGRLFEHFIILETYRLLHYSRSEARLYFWRTNHGAEVDLLIEKHGKLLGAYEIKSSSNISGAHLSGIRAFQEEHPATPCAVVCAADHGYRLGTVAVTPWQSYLAHVQQLV